MNTVRIIFKVVNDIMKADVGSNDASKEADGEHNDVLYTSTKENDKIVLFVIDLVRTV